MDFILHFIGSEALSAFAKLLPYLRFLRFKINKRGQRIRISFSALLSVCHGNRYLLISNLHRPDTFGPIGGVFKHNKSCRDMLRELEFEPQFSGNCDKKDLEEDLRGFLPAKNLFSLVRWFTRDQQRETGAECINREVAEELQEIGASFSPPHLRSHCVKKVRTVFEGPWPVPGTDYLQFRIVEIYELCEEPETQELLKNILEFSNQSGNLVLASSDEINIGRIRRGGTRPVGGEKSISHISEYLLRHRARRPPMPPIYS